MPDWFYKKDNKVIGPVSKQELDFLATEGRIRPSTQVRSGQHGEWKRFRPAKASASTTATTAIDDAPVNVEASSEPSSTDQIKGGPPKLDADRDRTRRQAAVGAILAVLLMLLLWFFWTQRSGSSLRGSSNSSGAGFAQNEVSSSNGGDAANDDNQTQSSAGAADTASATVADAGEDQSQAGDPLDNSGQGEVESESAGQADQDNAQSTASVDPNNDQKQDDDLATTTMDGLESIQAGDPMSKFTISAPGEAVFFGLRATGNRFAFVVDRSGSMDGVRMKRAREELMNCIQSMPKHVEVFVVFFNGLAEPDRAIYRKVDDDNLIELRKWVDSINPNGGTVVTAGVAEVFKQSKLPDAIFLLTDGDFDQGTPQEIKQLNRAGTVRINTIALVNRGGEWLLQQIAKENSGDYKFVP